ncbi:MAG: M28 family peptidase [Planctomycetota bacterium]|nr:M28 family peptidase [Planctomycetota bacterium]
MTDHEVRWLLELTAIPTAAGREHRVIRWIEAWTAQRPDLNLTRDRAGNLIIQRADAHQGPAAPRPLYITAHLDHPAFVIERRIAPGSLAASFRGGVLDPYFRGARLLIHPESGAPPVQAFVMEKIAAEPFAEWLLEVRAPADAQRSIAPGDIARWELPPPALEGDLVHTDACDDLSAVAAALATMERLRSRPDAAHLKLLFTRAEEIGFVGAIAACKLQTMEPASRVIALENSRSFAESPIGAGPVVRVGDRISVFSPTLTAAVAKVAERLAAASASSSAAPSAPFLWQRKLMPGGACEASAFQAFGYDATCVCVPLGNYHNMADLDRVQAADPAAVDSARSAREFISLRDYQGMIALLEAAAAHPDALEGAEALTTRLEKMYDSRRFVLD